MKTALVNKKSSQIEDAATSKPFFAKSAEDSFFSDLPTPAPFFNPIQSKLKVGPVDDINEREADTMADKVMRMKDDSVPPAFFSSAYSRVQRKCAHCEEEERLQRKSLTGQEFESDEGLHNYVLSLNMSGQPLPKEVRNYFEPRFGYDFSNVRIHTDAAAGKTAESIQALAFTTGNNIVFNYDQYSPYTYNGKKLLAHELTHVIQQSQSTSPNRVINRYWFGPQNKEGRKGSDIHNVVLPLFINVNPALFVEAPIPGANKKDVDTGNSGRADFYTSDTTRTIGVNFNKLGQPNYLGPHKSFKAGPRVYSHKDLASPLGTNKRKKSISNFSLAPKQICLGDLKPGFSSEEHLSRDQLNHYRKGIEETKEKVNNFKNTYPSQVFREKPAGIADPNIPDWLPEVKDITKLNIPDILTYEPGRNGIGGPKPLAVYRGLRRVVIDSHLVGGLFVYKSNVSGIWAYEWFPANIPQSIGHQNTDQALTRLNTMVIPGLQRKVKKSSKIQRKPLTSPSVFNLEGWKRNTFIPWQQESKASQQDKDVEKQTLTALALEDLSKRAKATKLSLPQRVSQTIKGHKKINVWIDHGLFYGILRKTFGSLYIKVSKVMSSLSIRMKKLFGSNEPNDTKGTGMMHKVAQTGFKIIKTYFKLMLGRVGEGLKESLMEGSKNIIEELFSEKMGEQYFSKVEEIKSIIEEMEHFKEESFLQPLEDWVKENYGLLKLFDEIKSILANARSIEQKIRWAIRAMQCATPPVTGCLKLLFSFITNELITRAINSCWFQKEVYLPAINSLKFFRELPSKIIDFLIENGNKLVPVPRFIKSKLFATKATVNTSLVKNDLPCNYEERIKEVNLAFAALEDKYSKERVDWLIQILNREKVGEKKEMGLDEIYKLDKALNEIKNVSDITLLEAQYYNPDPDNKQLVPLHEFVDKLKAYDQAIYALENPAKLDRWFFVVHPETYRNETADITISDVESCSHWNPLMKIRVKVKETRRKKHNKNTTKIYYKVQETIKFELGGSKIIDKNKLEESWGYSPDVMKDRRKCSKNSKKK